LPKGEKGLKNGVKEAGAKKICKFTESAWKLTYYLSTEICVVWITYKEPWFTDTSTFWHGWPHQTLKYPLKLFYTFQCGFYIYSVAALLVWETRRKDHNVMMSHHIVTIGLIAYSYITGSFRAGTVILALHDVSDIFMELAKLFKYCRSELGASICFGLFVLSWVLLRLIYFPFWVIWSTRSFFCAPPFFLFCESCHRYIFRQNFQVLCSVGSQEPKQERALELCCSLFETYWSVPEHVFIMLMKFGQKP
jgi:hypothetical protein